MADGPKQPVTGKHRQISRRGKTKKEAEKKVLDAIAKLKEYGIDETVVRKMTFEKLAAEWLQYWNYFQICCEGEIIKRESGIRCNRSKKTTNNRRY